MIVYIFNKETFIPYIINEAVSKRKLDKVATLGPLAVVLSFILYGASSFRKTEKLKLKRLFMVQKINAKLFDRYLRQIRKTIQLQGYYKIFQTQDTAITYFFQQETMH